jgi:hypothetical protein
MINFGVSMSVTFTSGSDFSLTLCFMDKGDTTTSRFDDTISVLEKLSEIDLSETDNLYKLQVITLKGFPCMVAGDASSTSDGE